MMDAVVRVGMIARGNVLLNLMHETVGLHIKRASDQWRKDDAEGDDGRYQCCDHFFHGEGLM